MFRPPASKTTVTVVRNRESEFHMTESPRILIVEDSAVVRTLLSQRLEKQGMQVTQAENGREGLAAALSNTFDLIISDVDMPVMDGFTLCREIKRNPATRRLPVIILSSHDTEGDIDRGFQVGASAYVSKSSAPKELGSAIKRVLESYQVHRSHLVMVVDDSLTVRGMVRKSLEKAGFRVVTAGNGKEALERIATSRPDLILSDIDMPVMNGIEFCKVVQNIPDYKDIPFVVMSANGDRSIMRRMLSQGAASFLVKPFNLEQLVITVEKLLSHHVLLMLKDKQRLEGEQRLFLAGITSLITALEARDHYTRGHSESVADLVCKMAHHMGMDETDIESLSTAARLHDIGKIGIPDSVLLKPGRLTDEEFSIIKSHPTVGTRILQVIPSMRELLPVILHHHERFDGRGYPDGLRGKEIPLWARMTAVADTYDALTSDRPYRKGMPRDRALNIISEVRGSQLCPDSVDVFLEIIAGNGAGHAVTAMRRTVEA